MRRQAHHSKTGMAFVIPVFVFPFFTNLLDKKYQLGYHVETEMNKHCEGVVDSPGCGSINIMMFSSGITEAVLR